MTEQCMGVRDYRSQRCLQRLNNSAANVMARVHNSWSQM